MTGVSSEVATVAVALRSRCGRGFPISPLDLPGPLHQTLGGSGTMDCYGLLWIAMDCYDVSLVGTLHHISCALRVFVFASWKSERVQSHASHESRERTENRESREKFESRKTV